MTDQSLTHQQRWRTRLRETHDRMDIYLPKALASDMRRQVAADETVSAYVERCLTQAMRGTGAPASATAPEMPTATALRLSSETLAYAIARAAMHGVSSDDFILAAMRGVSDQSAVMIRGLAKAGRRDALAATHSPLAGDAQTRSPAPAMGRDAATACDIV